MVDVRPLLLAVDIGGTKLAAGLVSSAGVLMETVSCPTPAGTDAETLFGVLVGLVDEVRNDAFDRLVEIDDSLGRPEVCGVGVGGPMGSQGEWVSPLNITAWRRFPLRQRLADHLGLPIYVDNDAKALALGEAWVGAASETENFIAMVVSTGVGGGIVLDGRLLDGTTGNAGHIGHVIVEPDGHECVCGSRGCLEAEASGTAIAKITGAPAAGADLAVKQRTGHMVGRGVSSVANLLDLQLAVVAGSVALGYGEAFFAAAQAEIDARSTILHGRGTVIRPAGLGAEGPLVGAAAVGRRGQGYAVGSVAALEGEQ